MDVKDQILMITYLFKIHDKYGLFWFLIKD